ncbi:hypothetical protein CHH65_13700 [Shouchella clausii]|uniref:AimR family lysis-lysogeny pheromone receptor n=1 Tax=Shouchella clausii TaxID=79880 RepID=UPI000BA6E291|nr:AimR family lysis-lysogeny pheromone receptor [Shouchella clausii]PAF08637.1 hypothetical protein CHH65_13700 [Shouchella clausii]
MVVAKATIESAEYLYHVVKTYMNEKKLQQIDVSHATGIRKEYISRFLSAKGKNDLEFSTVLNLIRYLAASEYLEIMDNYCLKLEKPLGIMNALEYASNYERHDLTSNLLALHAGHKKGEIREWLEVYDLNKRRKTMSPYDVMDACRNLYGKVTSDEVKVKIDLIEAVSTYTKDYKSLLRMCDRIETKIKQLRDGFIKESFKIRFFNLHANAVLYYKNDVDTALEHTEYVIKNKVSPTFLVASAHLIRGQAQMYDRKEESIQNIRTAAKLFKLAGYSDYAQNLLENDLVFVQNYHRDIVDLENLKDGELAHQLLVRGDREKACEVLSKLDDKDPFTLLYKGMAFRDMSYFIEGHAIIVRDGKTFFKRAFEREFYQFAERG